MSDLCSTQRNILSSEVDSVKAFTLSFVDNLNTAMIADWRLVNTGSSNFIHPDWPIPVNLAYTDADLLTGGTMGEPVGDLNWFPAQKAQWNKAAEDARLEDDLNSGVLAVKNHGTQPAIYDLCQNYPNPFNPSTRIEYQLPVSSHVVLRVYDVLGREVATLVNGIQDAGVHAATFDGTRLASGVYIYRLTASGISLVKKMLLEK